MSSFADMIHASTRHNQTKAGGTSWGVVVDNEDPGKLGRIKVKMPWHTDSQSTDWIPRGNSGGSGYGSTMNIPQPGETVSVQYEEGSQHFPVYSSAVWSDGGSDHVKGMPANQPPTIPF